MADKQVVTETEPNGVVYLEYYVWNDEQVNHLIMEPNNLIFNEVSFILKSLQIKAHYGVILNEHSSVIYTGKITTRSTDIYVPVTVRAIRVLKLTERDEQQINALNNYRHMQITRFINYDKLYIDKLLDIPKLPRTGIHVTVPFVKEKGMHRYLMPGFYERYEIDVPIILIHPGTVVSLMFNNDETVN